MNKIYRNLLFLAVILTAVGVIAVADASAPSALSNFSDKYFFVKQQAVWGAIGLVSLLVVSQVSYKLWEKIAVPLFIFSIITLVVVLLPSFGTKIFGARRWIVLGPISFQPSEIVKLALAVYLAKVASKEKMPMAYFLPMILVAGLIMLQPDLGTAIVVTGIGLTQIFLSGIGLFHFIGVLLIGGVASIMLILVSDYRRDRLMTFLKTTQDPLGKSYHIRQILIALGSGGLFGVGLGQSKQKYLFLPEAATDSIFAVIAEETGFLGASVIILLFALFIFLGIRIIKGAPDKFSQILSSGIIAWIGGQAFVNIASMLALIPLTGIPLPFFSYGGSSLTTVLVATGILLNISKYGKL